MSSGVLFDLDDTLFDHQHARRSALMALIAAYPALTGQSVETMERAHEHHLQSTHKRLLRGETTLSDARRERMRLLFVELGAVAHDGDWDHVEHVYRSSYNDNRRAIPGVIALIDRLRPSRKLGIITNGLSRRISSSPGSLRKRRGPWIST